MSRYGRRIVLRNVYSDAMWRFCVSAVAYYAVRLLDPYLSGFSLFLFAIRPEW